MYVSLCNQADVSEAVLSGAKEEIAIAYQAAGVTIHWVACEDVAAAKMQYGERYFVIRLRNETFLPSARSVSLDTMGRAYTERRGSGYLADAYLSSVAHFGVQHDIDLEALLGLVVSHELGHLLLGPGHSAGGIMFAQWTRRETEAGRRRWLRFNQSEAALMVEQLQERGAAGGMTVPR
jgi:hypothetical protein